MMLWLKTWPPYLAVTAYFPSGCHLSSPTKAEGRFQDYAETIEGDGETPSVGSSSTRVGVSA